jgi:DNA-binding transcriptional MerR regulator
VSSRSYLSIGDVLTLLRQEFPDVTISKIRFLESQGLVNPERTPSGYRKFYEHDVERLRWVLRQQREHFLPLKVIKDRLDEDNGTGADAAAAEAGTTGSGADAAAVESGPARADATMVDGTPARGDDRAPVEVGAGEAPPTVEATVSARPTASPAEPTVTTPTGGAPRLVAVPDPMPSEPEGPSRPGLEPSTRRRAPARAAVGATAASGGGSSASGRTHRPTIATGGDVTVGNARGNGSTERTETTASAAKPPRAAKPTPPTPAAGSAPGSPTTGSRGGSDDQGPTESLGSPGGASLSMEDLCSSSGLSVEDVVQLQEYGLLSASVTAGVEFFDEDALTVANLAAQFASFGIEARHLRLYKNAADREAGFIEQVVIPMVRQRNPEARARATQTAEDLARLGQQLRGSLLRVALRDILAP